MSTASSSAEGETPATGPGEGPDGASPSDNAGTATAAAARAPKRRRIPGLVLALAGAAAATGYGYGVLGMRPSPPLVMLGLGGLVLVLCALALWRMVDPLTSGDRAAAASVAAARTPFRIRELEREKQAVLKAIKEIELDYQMRKIDERDYREMVERYRTRALRVMSELADGDNYGALIERELKDRLARRVLAGAALPAAASDAAGPTGASAGDGAGDGASPPVNARATSAAIVGAGPACPACAAPNDPDAQFCKRCGQKITISPGAG